MEIAGPFSPKFAKVLRILLRCGLFPECWREANITSIPKGAPSSVVTEYRPISITPVLLKVYEKVISCRMISHLIHESVFPGCQFAYRSGRGTCDLLLTLDHVLQSCLNRAAEIRVVQLDFSAAFDRVNHSGLIYKLKSVGVGGPVLSVLEPFLSNRRHRVFVDGSASVWSDVVSGVPQGSVLGPILFVLYTSDLSHVIDSQVYCYADDTTQVAPVQRPSLRAAVGDVLNDDLPKVVDWCERWDIKLDPRKSKSLLVSRSRSEHPPHPLLYADGDPIQEEHHMKVLSVVLYSKLTYVEHLR